MGDLTKYPNSNSSSGNESKRLVVPKEEIPDFEMPSHTVLSRNFEDNVASSSGSNLRSSFIGMGFLPSLVDKVIEEQGEDDVDLILETLFAYSAPQKSNSQSSDSLDSLFDDNYVSSPPATATLIQPKEEPDMADGVNDGKRASLLMMNFSVNEVEFAIDKLGEDAPIDELVDFIFAAQIAERFEKDTDGTTHNDEDKNEGVSNEALFGTMEKTLRLLEMGFSENQISCVIENFGSEAPISELADSIVVGRTPINRIGKNKVSVMQDMLKSPYDKVKIENRDFSTDDAPQAMDMNVQEIYLGKRPKQEHIDDYSGAAPQFRHKDYEEIRKGKRPKQEYVDDSSYILGPTWQEERTDSKNSMFGMVKPISGNPGKSLNNLASKSPYFLYGNVADIGHETWAKVSKFLYAIEPEFVNTQFFSSLSRKEGYVHNLPTENRFHIIPKPPMTVQDAIPYTKKWWPSWDTRKQLSYVSPETNGVSLLCDRLGKMLTESHGLLSYEQKKEILHHCRSLNLVWVGQYKLEPVEPEYLERILGYPLNHTQAVESSLLERLQSLRYCFQTDALGYYLSVLKSMYPGGLTLLSIFSGIGGAEITLHRLGIHLRGVVSVETSGMKRRVLKRWWQNTGQTGVLVQIEDIQRLTSNKLESLVEKFGGFDFIICQNPCNGDSPVGFEFSLFSEFVRVFQRVRNMMEKRRATTATRVLLR